MKRVSNGRPKHRFTGKVAGPGRPKGSKNKAPTVLKEAMLKAAEICGNMYPVKYKNEKIRGLVAFLLDVSINYPETYIRVMARILPLEITGKDDGPITVVEYQSIEEAMEELRKRGIPPEKVAPLLGLPAPTHDTPKARM